MRLYSTFSLRKPPLPLVKLPGRKYRLSNSPVVNSSAEYSPEEKYPTENSTVFIKCFFFTSFNKNEAWTFHRIKIYFCMFPETFFASLCFGNLFKLWICWEPWKYWLGKFNYLWTLPYHLCLFSHIDPFKGALQKLLVLIKNWVFNNYLLIFAWSLVIKFSNTFVCLVLL